MGWQVVGAIASILTVLAVLAGGGVMLWLLNKPKIHLLSPQPTGEWYYIYKEGEKLIGAEIIISMRLENNGKEATTISGTFEINIRGKQHTFCSNEKIRLEGEGTIIETNMWLRATFQGDYLQEGDCLHGLLKLEPWGNRRLIFGKKYLTVKLNIPENQSKRYARIF